MKWQEILSFPPTLDEHNSYLVFGEILSILKWRCYSSEQFDDIEFLIENFLSGQAVIPGFISDKLIATRPIDILFGKSAGFRLRGATYLNGAFAEVSNEDGDANLLLFVDDETAEQFNYPTENYIYTSEFFIKEEDEDHSEDATPSQ